MMVNGLAITSSFQGLLQTMFTESKTQTTTQKNVSTPGGQDGFLLNIEFFWQSNFVAGIIL